MKPGVYQLSNTAFIINEQMSILVLKLLASVIIYTVASVYALEYCIQTCTAGCVYASVIGISSTNPFCLFSGSLHPLQD